MVYDITTNQRRDDNTKSSNQEPQNIDYPPFADQIHGLSLALLSKSRKLRVFWWIVFCICTCCGMVTTSLVIIEYIQVPTATSITLKLVPSLELPSITVCPEIPDAFNLEPLFNNIKSRLPSISNKTALDLIHFWLGGSGIGDITYIKAFKDVYLDQLGDMFKIWSDGYDTESFFNLIQTEYGYKCTDLFTQCILSDQPRDCCAELFKPIWIIKRGVCYQSRRNINQTQTTGTGRFYAELKAPFSITTPDNIQPSILVYVSDNFEHVFTASNYRLLPGDTTIMHLSARLVELQEHPNDCTGKIIGKDALCFVNKWVNAILLEPFNCTFPYLKDLDISKNFTICDPLTIVSNYKTINRRDLTVENRKCITGCTKWEYEMWIENRYTREYNNPQFHFVIGFDDLQYEHVKEISTITISGLLSQIGGQLGLFLGLSIITMFQIFIYCVNMIIRFLSRVFHPLAVGPIINRTEYTVNRVDDRRLHCDNDISSYV